MASTRLKWPVLALHHIYMCFGSKVQTQICENIQMRTNKSTMLLFNKITLSTHFLHPAAERS